MKYYIECTQQYSAPNKLVTAVYEMIKEFDRLVIDINYLPVIQSSITNVINELNKQHPRCTPLDPKWSENKYDTKASKISDKHKDWSLNLSANLYYTVLSVKLCRELTDL